MHYVPVSATNRLCSSNLAGRVRGIEDMLSRRAPGRPARHLETIMRVCVITAVIFGHDWDAPRSDCVIAATLAECKRKAKQKWKWYGLNHAERYFYDGTDCGETTTRWMKLDD